VERLSHQIDLRRLFSLLLSAGDLSPCDGIHCNVGKEMALEVRG